MRDRMVFLDASADGRGTVTRRAGITDEGLDGVTAASQAERAICSRDFVELVEQHPAGGPPRCGDGSSPPRSPRPEPPPRPSEAEPAVPNGGVPARRSAPSRREGAFRGISRLASRCSVAGNPSCPRHPMPLTRPIHQRHTQRPRRSPRRQRHRGSRIVRGCADARSRPGSSGTR